MSTPYDKLPSLQDIHQECEKTVTFRDPCIAALIPDTMTYSIYNSAVEGDSENNYNMIMRLKQSNNGFAQSVLEKLERSMGNAFVGKNPLATLWTIIHANRILLRREFLNVLNHDIQHSEPFGLKNIFVRIFAKAAENGDLNTIKWFLSDFLRNKTPNKVFCANLLKSRIYINQKDEPLPAIAYAAKMGHLDVVKFLAEQVSFDTENYLVVIPVMQAIINGHKDIVEYLCRNNSNVFHQFLEGEKGEEIDILSLAKQLNKMDILAMLQQIKANLPEIDTKAQKENVAVPMDTGDDRLSFSEGDRKRQHEASQSNTAQSENAMQDDPILNDFANCLLILSTSAPKNKNNKKRGHEKDEEDETHNKRAKVSHPNQC